MICVAIKGPSLADAKKQIAASLKVADLVELYLDSFETLDIGELLKEFPIPIILTLRSKEQGGKTARSQEERLNALRRLAALNPEYLDLEISDPPTFIQEIKATYPEIKIILSYHNFEETPDLETVYKKMQTLPAQFYKIAVMAKNSLDTMRLLIFAKEKNKNIIMISMGPFGQISRILAPLIKSPITYASIESGQESAPGQLTANTLIERYHYPSLNSDTALYGLIGDPIDQSVSDVSHNHIFNKFNLNAAYVKIPVKAEELPEFITLAKRLDVKGLSVTMPLKEAIIPLLDEICPEAQKIGAVNTLNFDNGKVFGCNTDGFGALNALEKTVSVKDSQVVIIGAGGAAKAIGFEAKKRGALLTIINRDINKAHRLAEELKCSSAGLDQMPLCAQKGYALLINTTPLSLPIDPSDILPTSYVMDIKTRPQETLLIKHAKEKSCTIIYGYEMFIEQALGQYNLWFQGKIPTNTARELLTAKIQATLN